VWFTGLSGSGKSTVALAVEEALLREQVAPGQALDARAYARALALCRLYNQPIHWC
jgi:adenylylsulfate kinase-like enzyme